MSDRGVVEFVVLCIVLMYSICLTRVSCLLSHAINMRSDSSVMRRRDVQSLGVQVSPARDLNIGPLIAGAGTSVLHMVLHTQ